MATWNAPHIPPFRPRARTQFWNYPRPHRTGLKAWLPSWRFIVGIMLAGTSLVAGVLMAAWTSITIPAELETLETSTVRYAGDGGKLGEFKGDENRKIITVDELPIWVANSVVASEDRDFYSANNLGISFKGITRAAVTGEGGGSTLTQQYVEQVYTKWNPNPTYVDKFEEMVLAMKVRAREDEYPPEEILGEYLNRIYLGRSAYGIETAAQAYYGKSAQKLTPSESAFLAGIVPSPNAYNDTDWGPEWAEGRWERTLSLMHADGYIDDEQYGKAVEAGFPTPKEYKASSSKKGPKGYILREIERELEAEGFDPAQLLSDGLVVHTTVDKKLQASAQKAATLPEDANTPYTRSSLVSIDPKTGAIRAMYGGPDFADPAYHQSNAATDNWQQGGSTYKPFTLIAALEEGIPLGKLYDGNDSQTFDYYTERNDAGVEEPKPVTNFDNYNPGQIDLVEATTHSVNTVYVQLNHEAGAAKQQDVAKRLGLDEPGSNAYRKWVEKGEPEGGPGETSKQMSNVLGTPYVYTYDLARAYATIANGGVRTTPHLVEKVVDPDTDEVLYETEVSPESGLFDPQDIANATYAMSQVVDDPDGSGHHVRTAVPQERPVAGKTGTSNGNYSAWFAGFTPQLATVVGLYEYDPEGNEGKGKFNPLTPFGGHVQMTGGSWPVEAWTSYMATATEGMPIEQFPPYEHVKQEPTPSPSPTPSEDEMVTVPPGLIGLDWNEARNKFVDAGVNAQKTDVPSQHPKGVVINYQYQGQEIPRNETLVVEVSSGPEQNSNAPSVIGMDENQARNTLRQQGYGMNPVYEQHDTAPQGTAFEQDPPPGGELPQGQPVTVKISTGPGDDPGGDDDCGILPGQEPCDQPSEEPGPGGGGNSNGGGG